MNPGTFKSKVKGDKKPFTPPAKWFPLRVTASSRPLQRMLTIILCRFDPRATVHHTRLYKQKQTLLKAFTLGTF